MKKNKKRDKIKIQFIGENAHDVTGSMTLIEFGRHKILIDAGLYQGNSVVKDYKINSRKFKGFKPSEITAIFLEHSNIDHCGLVSKLYKESCNASIYIPKGNYELLKLLLTDSAYIINKNATFLDLPPIYEQDDVENALFHMVESEFGIIHKIDDELSFRYTHSGHIFKAAQLELFITVGNKTKKILYTGDLGNVAIGSKPFVDDFQPVDFCNILIGETTYAGNPINVNQKTRDKDLEKIKSVIEEVCIHKKKGRVLIPCFSYDRTQTILKVLYDMFKDNKDFKSNIILDSPLAIKISNVYSKTLEGKQKEDFDEMLSWDRLKMITELDESKTSVTDTTPSVILSASGFMMGGRVLHYLENIVEDVNSVCMFVGYSSPESLAGQIKNGKLKTIKLNNKEFKNRCRVVELKSFSSHMQHKELLSYYSTINSESVYLVHGDLVNKARFAEELDAELKKKCKSTKVWIVNKGDSVEL